MRCVMDVWKFRNGSQASWKASVGFVGGSMTIGVKVMFSVGATLLECSPGILGDSEPGDLV